MRSLEELDVMLKEENNRWLVTEGQEEDVGRGVLEEDDG